jgi:type I restriction enzyme R subunit
MLTEADTCRQLITPKLYAAGWSDEQICEQRTFTDGRIISHGDRTRATRRPARRADYILRLTRDFPLAVVEAKAARESAALGIQQAKGYAEILGLRFAYAANGADIIEIDYTTGLERPVPAFPSPAELWARLRADTQTPFATPVLPPLDDTAAASLLTPDNLATGKPPRYYQRIAIERAARAILQGRKRLLLTMATGTGKTTVAFQICWKLWTAKWNTRADPARKPRILYLADRNFLIDDPKDKDFAPFGDARHKIENGAAVFSRELYFATYQSIARDERRPGLYREFAPGFFDLVIVDECHRGSARDDSNWREILAYFAPATQLGMTATPLRDDNRDTYLYFGNPLYTYSLRQGIEDGFLAPYRVRRIVTQWDAAGWRPSKEDLDRHGQHIPDEEYHTPDFERRIALRARTEAVARHLADFLKKTDRFAKTIVFCVDQEHAAEMRAALNNLNADLVRQYPDYVCRVTSDEGDIGHGHRGRFQDIERKTPVILTTSQLLTTGLDAPTCRNVVLVRLVNSIVEFKQIIGRGTRVREDDGKLTFNILDYTGAATRAFADSDFDGEPAFAAQEEIDAAGQTTRAETLIDDTPEDSEDILIDSDPTIGDPPADPPYGGTPGDDTVPPRPRKIHYDGGRVEIIAELVHELDTDGRQLRVVKLTDYTAEKVRTLCADAAKFRARWTDTAQRAGILRQLADRGIDYATVAAQAGRPDADPFDLLCHLAYNAPLLTRRQRADRVKKQETAFFNYYTPEAREILTALLENTPTTASSSSRSRKY